MISIKVINLSENFFDNKNLPKKKVNKKKNSKEIKIEQPITSISFDNSSIL